MVPELGVFRGAVLQLPRALANELPQLDLVIFLEPAGLVALGDVAEGDQALLVGARDDSLQADPGRGPVGRQEGQLTGAGSASGGRFGHLLQEAAAARGVQQPRKRATGQPAAVDAQEGAGHEVGPADEAARIQREEADGRKVVEVRVFREGGEQLFARLDQLVVLQLQLDLVDLQLIEQAQG